MRLRIPTGDERQRLASSFENASPFPHVVLDDLIVEPHELSGSFPNADWQGWTELGDAYQRNKFSCSAINKFPQELAAVVNELNSSDFLIFLEQVTGIGELIPDPHFTGGGLHLSTEGGVLSLHTDFHYYKRLNLYRRLNLILYLNDNWSVGDGGELELCSSGSNELAARVAPSLGRVVLFETNDNSVHGFRNPVGPGCERKSIALYYYTAIEAPEFSGDETTHWREHFGAEKRHKTRFFLYRNLIRISRIFSLAAHVVNPNQGVGLLRKRLGQRTQQKNL